MKDVKYKFSGHQTFVFRYGWLEKGVHGVEESPTIFSDDDSLVRLGVGKNMVSSIKHWCLVTQLVEPDFEKERNTGRYLRVSDIGRKLLLDGGWDPFLEDDASLWLIHWLLVSNPFIGTIWQILFSQFHRPDFTKRELLDYLISFAEKKSLKIQEKVILRDVDCLLRTYASGTNGKKQTVAEETFNSPLLELNLLQLSPDGELYRFAIGPKPSLPTSVFAYALGEYLERDRSGRKTMSIQECLYGMGSPGQAFKLDENSLIEYIEDLEDYTEKSIMLDETAGLKQIYWQNHISATQILNDYFRGSSRK